LKVETTEVLNIRLVSLTSVFSKRLLAFTVQLLLLIIAYGRSRRAIVARAKIYSTTSQNMDYELRWTDRGREKKINIAEF
jgi:hypothetical protein